MWNALIVAKIGALRHVELSRAPLAPQHRFAAGDSANVLVAMNEPSLRKFDECVCAGGWMIYNGDQFRRIVRATMCMCSPLPFTRLADELGDARAGEHGDAGRAAGNYRRAAGGERRGRAAATGEEPAWIELDERAMARGENSERILEGAK